MLFEPGGPVDARLRVLRTGVWGSGSVKTARRWRPQLREVRFHEQFALPARTLGMERMSARDLAEHEGQLGEPIGKLMMVWENRSPLAPPNSRPVCLVPQSGSVLRVGNVAGQEGPLRSCGDWKAG